MRMLSLPVSSESAALRTALRVSRALTLDYYQPATRAARDPEPYSSTPLASLERRQRARGRRCEWCCQWAMKTVTRAALAPAHTVRLCV
eukprot:1838265-Rhodomonas_salina.2